MIRVTFTFEEISGEMKLHKLGVGVGGEDVSAFCWCFEPSQPQGIVSGLKTNFFS